MKTLMLGVSCSSEKGENFPNTFTITLTDTLVARIKELSALVKNVGIHTAEDFCSEGTWSRYDYDRACEPDTLHDNELEGIRVDMTELSVAVEVPKIRITGGGFNFVSIPKFCSSADKVFSETVPLNALDKEGVYVSM